MMLSLKMITGFLSLLLLLVSPTNAWTSFTTWPTTTVPPENQGVCPLPPWGGVCRSDCYNHYNCGGVDKCCFTGYCRKCTLPVYSTPTIEDTEHSEAEHSETEHSEGTEHSETEHSENTEHSESEHLENTEHSGSEHSENTEHSESEHLENTEHSESEHSENTEHSVSEHSENTEHSEVCSESGNNCLNPKHFKADLNVEVEFGNGRH